MHFTNAAVAQVFSEYERRNIDEQAKLAALGNTLHARRDEFLLPIGPEVGRFLHSLILAKRPARVLELGTSYGYSTLFLADAVKQTGGRMVTMDLADYKQAHARAMLDKAGISDVVEFRRGDAVAMIDADSGPFDFVLLDIWKELYVPCLRAVYPKLSDEGIIAADNIIEPPMWREDARKYRSAVGSLPGMQSALIPIGNGIELSVKWSAANTKL
ncbi:MAG: class I SAM-dependent methyltransferase [Pseudomonadota bacterium]|nr:class I SAM-dependent methyltransferase [Pseudomonadota bacterium]